MIPLPTGPIGCVGVGAFDAGILFLSRSNGYPKERENCILLWVEGNMAGGCDVQDVSVGWFLGRLHILEERMRSSEQEIAEMREEHGMLLRRLRDAGHGSLAGENPSLVDAKSETCARFTENEEVDSLNAKWVISSELSELVTKACSPPQLQAMSAHEGTPSPLSSVLTHRSSAPSKLYSWEEIMEKDRIRSEKISKLNRKYRWFTQAAERLAERMTKAKHRREALESFNCADNNNTKEKVWLSSTTDRLSKFRTAAVIHSTKAPPVTKIFKKQADAMELVRSWQEPKIDNDKMEECGMRCFTDRFRIHWNATFASATLITENAQSIGAFSPRNICSETPAHGNHHKRQQNQITSFLSEKRKHFATTAIHKSANLQKKQIFSKDFSTGFGDGTPFDDKVRASLEYTHILKTITESGGGCLKKAE